MRLKLTLLVILTRLLAGPASAAESAWQWTDSQGQVHFGDRPPVNSESSAIDMQHSPGRSNGSHGLRPAERKLLGQMKRRQQQQQRRTQATGKRADRERAANRARCDEHRKKLRSVPGRDAFKEHARYMRNNCW